MSALLTTVDPDGLLEYSVVFPTVTEPYEREILRRDMRYFVDH